MSWIREYDFLVPHASTCISILLSRSRPRRTPTNVQQSLVRRASSSPYNLSNSDFWHPTRKRSILRTTAGITKRRRKGSNVRRITNTQRKQYLGYVNDPQPGVVQELYPWTAMCVRNVDVHVSCSSHVDAQLAAFFIDPRAKWSTVQGNRILCKIFFFFLYFYKGNDEDYPDTESFFSLSLFSSNRRSTWRERLVRSMVAEPIRLKKNSMLKTNNSFRYVYLDEKIRKDRWDTKNSIGLERSFLPISEANIRYGTGVRLTTRRPLFSLCNTDSIFPSERITFQLF